MSVGLILFVPYHAKACFLQIGEIRFQRGFYDDQRIFGDIPHSAEHGQHTFFVSLSVRLEQSRTPMLFKNNVSAISVGKRSEFIVVFILSHSSYLDYV